MNSTCFAAPLVFCLVYEACQAADPKATEPQGIPVPAGTALPPWPKPAALASTPNRASVRSKGFELTQSPTALGAFEARLDGELLGLGQSMPLIGYVAGGQVRWFNPPSAASAKHTVKVEGKSVRVSLEGHDPDGALWRIQQRFSPGPIEGAVAVTTEVTVDQERSVAFLPLLMVFPGAGTFGATKGLSLIHI